MDDQAKRQFSLTHTVSTLGVMAVIVCALKLDGLDIRSCIKLSPFLLVAGLPFFLLLGGFGKTFLQFVPDAFLTLFTTPLKPRPEFAEIARYGNYYTLGAGMLGTVLGLIETLSQLESPSEMGPAIASTFLSVFYALIIAECFYASLYRAYMTPDAASRPLGKKGLLLILCGVLLMLSVFFIMMYAVTEELYHRSDDASSGERSYEVSGPSSGERDTVVMEDFLVNVGDLNQKRIVKFSVCLMLSDPRLAPAIDHKALMLRDRIATVASAITEAQLANANARDYLKNAIREEVNKLVGPLQQGVVTEVVFPNYLFIQLPMNERDARREALSGE